MEKYCIENADPDILLDELTEVKKHMNPIPKILPFKVPFREIDTNKEETLEKTKVFDSILNDVKNSFQNQQQEERSDMSETQKIML